MNDDDIPVLTQVVKRERRAEPTLTAELRDAIAADVSRDTHKLVANIIADSAGDIIDLFREQLLADIEARLPALIAEAISARIDAETGD